jgi:hypothetical protein
MKKLDLDLLLEIKEWLNEAEERLKIILPRYDVEISDIRKKWNRIKERLLKNELVGLLEVTLFGRYKNKFWDKIFVEDLRFPIVGLLYAYRGMPEIPLKDKLKQIYRKYMHDIHWSKVGKRFMYKGWELSEKIRSFESGREQLLATMLEESLIKYFLKYE